MNSLKYNFIERRNFISLLVKDLKVRYGSGYKDVFEILNFLGIKILTDDDVNLLNGAFGMFLSSPDGVGDIVVIDMHRSKEDMLYTLAHELGHYLLGHKNLYNDNVDVFL